MRWLERSRRSHNSCRKLEPAGMQDRSRKIVLARRRYHGHRNCWSVDWMTGATFSSAFQLYERNASYLGAESTQISDRSQRGRKRRHGFCGARSTGSVVSSSGRLSCRRGSASPVSDVARPAPFSLTFSLFRVSDASNSGIGVFRTTARDKLSRRTTNHSLRRFEWEGCDIQLTDFRHSQNGNHGRSVYAKLDISSGRTRRFENL